MPPDLVRFLKELDKSRDLGPQDHRDKRFNEIVHRAQCICFRHRQPVILIGREENDRRMSRFFPAPDQLGRLKSVQAVHLNIEQDDCKVIHQQAAQGFLSGQGFYQVQSKVLQDRFQGEQVRWLIVHKQDVHFAVRGGLLWGFR